MIYSKVMRGPWIHEIKLQQVTVNLFTNNFTTLLIPRDSTIDSVLNSCIHRTYFQNHKYVIHCLTITISQSSIDDLLTSWVQITVLPLISILSLTPTKFLINDISVNLITEMRSQSFNLLNKAIKEIIFSLLIQKL